MQKKLTANCRLTVKTNTEVDTNYDRIEPKVPEFFLPVDTALEQKQCSSSLKVFLDFGRE
jgi:hypothetical protein